MLQVWNTLGAVFGLKLLTLFLVILSLMLFSTILYINIKSGLNLKKIILIGVICIGGFIFAWRQPYFAEKAHVLQFGLLGWLVMRDLNRQKANSWKIILMGFIFVTIISCLTEGLQKFLPWRVFEVRDIITEVLSGIGGIILYRLSQARTSTFIGLFWTPVKFASTFTLSHEICPHFLQANWTPSICLLQVGGEGIIA